MAGKRGCSLAVIASAFGTEAVPHKMSLQVKILQEADVLVFRSNALVTAACCILLVKE